MTAYRKPAPSLDDLQRAAAFGRLGRRYTVRLPGTPTEGSAFADGEPRSPLQKSTEGIRNSDPDLFIRHLDGRDGSRP